MYQKQSAFEMSCLCSVITEKVLVCINNVTHVKTLSKHFTEQMDIHVHHTIKVVSSHKIAMLEGENI
jgi:hypothetical protein